MASDHKLNAVRTDSITSEICSFYNSLESHLAENCHEILHDHINAILDQLTEYEGKFRSVKPGSLMNQLLDKFSSTKKELELMKNDIEKPFLLFVVGMGKFGKSTLINVLLQEEVAETDVLPKTWKIDIFESAANNRDAVTIVFNKGNNLLLTKDKAVRFLEDEEKKRIDSEAEVIGTFKKNIHRFSTIEEKEEYRKNLERKNLYISPVVEVWWPVHKKPILDNFRLVDTPGLTQSLLGEVKLGVSEYYYKADGVIWILDATKISSKQTHHLIEEAKSLLGNCDWRLDNTVAVLNRIDVVYNQYGSEGVSRVLTQAKNLYGSSFQTIIPISAKRALEGYKNNNEDSVRESNISCLTEYITNVFFLNARIIRYSSKVNGISALLKQLKSAVVEYIIKFKEDTGFYDDALMKSAKNSLELKTFLQEKTVSTLNKYSIEAKKRIRINANYLASLNDKDFATEYIRNEVLQLGHLDKTIKSHIETINNRIEKFYEYHISSSTISEYRYIKNNDIFKNRETSHEITPLDITSLDIDVIQSQALGIGAIGAIIGSFIFPGLGTLIGGALGGLLGSFTQELDQTAKVTNIENELYSKTDDLANDLTAKVIALIEKNVVSVLEEIYNNLDITFRDVHCDYGIKSGIKDLIDELYQFFVDELGDVNSAILKKLFSEKIRKNKYIYEEE